MSNLTIDSPSPFFLLQRANMRLCEDLMGGTRAMIAAGKRYIPREEGEDASAWRMRLERTILFNVYKRTLRYLCGRVFEKQVSLESGADEWFESFCDNVDRMGNNLTVWSRKSFESGLNAGVSFCLVDYANLKTREGQGGQTEYLNQSGQWEAKTEAADRANQWAPYFIGIDAKNVLDARIEWIDGRPRVASFRYIENLTLPDGQWGIKTIQRIRACFFNAQGEACWQLWRNGGDKSPDWMLEDEGIFSIGVLPVCAFMPGEKQGDLTAEPALQDLAELNKRHWQATSSQYELMEFVRRPPWFGRALGEFDHEAGKTKVIFGAGKLCLAEDASASLQSIGVDPGSVAAGRQELEDIENRMAIYGLQLLQPKTGAITATESLRDSEENNSTLKAWALLFQDYLENCFYYAALWRHLPDGPGVRVNTGFTNALDASILLDLFRAQVISGETLLGLIKGLGILPDDFDVEEESGKIAAGLMANGTGSAALASFLRKSL